MNVPSTRQEITNLFCKLYMEDNMSVKQIAETTNYSVYTIRSYLSQAGCRKRKSNKNQSKNKEQQPDKINQQEKDYIEIFEDDVDIEKPYEPLYDNYVLYKGRVWKKLTSRELKRLLIEEQEKRYGKKSLASEREKRKKSISR